MRVWHVLSADFPLNDGGLFYVMAEEIRQNGYRLPAFTGYNSAGIPFGYSPLGFYVAAALVDATGLGMLDALRFVPLAVSCLTLVAFVSLARDLLASRAALVAAAFAFALVPRSFVWLIMGGGLTRSFGFLFATLALQQMNRFYVRRRWRHVPWAVLLCGLTVLSHLGTAPFLAFSVAIFFVARGRHREGLLGSALVALGTIAVTAPWWLAVLAEHGLTPFVTANSSGASIFSDEETRRGILIDLARFNIGATSEAFFPLIGVLAILGGAVSLLRGDVLLTAWWVAIVLLDARQGSTFASVPVSLLAGIGTAAVLLPILHRRPLGGEPPGAGLASGRRLAVALLLALLVYATGSALARHPLLTREGSYLGALDRSDREAMAWVARHTPPESRLLLLTAGQWWSDRVSEWFPVLARRVSVATVQGFEWIPDGGFMLQKAKYSRAQRCAHWAADAHCLDQWSEDLGETFTHVYIAQGGDKMCCRFLIPSLAADPRYRLVFRNARAIVFERLPESRSVGLSPGR